MTSHAWGNHLICDDVRNKLATDAKPGNLQSRKGMQILESGDEKSVDHNHNQTEMLDF